MVRTRNCIIVLLVAFCLGTPFYAIVPIMSIPSAGPSPGEYDLWLDWDGNGVINMIDISRAAKAFGKSGENATKACQLYDSGWINLTGYEGENYTIIDNLNLPTTGVIVDARQKTQTWEKTYGGVGIDLVGFAGSVVQTFDGGYALAGYTNSSGAGGPDFYLVKTDADGNMQWSKTYGGTNTDVATSLIQTSDSGYALGGYTYSSGAGEFDFYLVKTDADGNMQWSKTYGGPNEDVAWSLVQTVDGGYALAGYTNSSDTGEDFYLVKTDADGNMQWSKTYGGPSDDEALSLVETISGGYTLAGQTASFGAGATDSYLIRTDASGNMLWNKTYGGLWYDGAWSLVETSEGGYALAGYTTSFGAGKADFYLVKTGADGSILWNKTYGGTNNEYVNSIVQAVDDGYALAGYTYSFGAGSADFYLVRTDASGNMLWNRTYGGLWYDVAWSLVETSDGGYVLAGETNSFGAGATDVYLVKTEGESGLTWLSSTANSVTLVRNANSPWSFVRVQIWRKR